MSMTDLAEGLQLLMKMNKKEYPVTAALQYRKRLYKKYRLVVSTVFNMNVLSDHIFLRFTFLQATKSWDH